jgi:hypothetical protein
MAQQIINVGTAPNDGLGDPLRTAFTKTNNNFSQLFATAGVSGIANGSSNVNIPQSNGNVVISSAGTANVITVTGTGVNVAGTLNSSGLATLSNLSITGTVISTGTIQSLADVTAVTITASGNLSANNAVITGNVTGGLFTGNGSGLTGVIATGNVGAATQLTNGTTTMNIPVANGNMIGNVGGVLNIFTLSTGGLEIAGIVSVSGNVTGGNLLTGGLISATGNITGNYILGNGSQLTSINAVTVDITDTNGLTTVYYPTFVENRTTAQIARADVDLTYRTDDNLLTVGNVSVTGNITGGNLLTGGLISATSTITSAANVTGGNVLTAGLISATSTITSAANITGGNILTGGLISATANITGGNILTGGLISATSTITSAANVTGGNLITGGLISATSTITSAANITGGNILTGGLISATGNVLGNVFTVNLGNTTTAIINGGGNAVGNIGSSSNYFNQVFAQATTALYADLAEIYSADAEYAPGTVVSFGGNQEVTKSITPEDARVAGVISEKPSYLMNSGLNAEYRAAVALTGRVPTLVIGPVAKGDMMVSAGNGWAQACVTPAMGTVIGKALVNFDGDSGIIEIVVGRL